jgi:hypothetical protein
LLLVVASEQPPQPNSQGRRCKNAWFNKKQKGSGAAGVASAAKADDGLKEQSR